MQFVAFFAWHEAGQEHPVSQYTFVSALNAVSQLIISLPIVLPRLRVPVEAFVDTSSSWRREIAQCTGTLIGSLRQHVLTAGHCLVDNSAGGSTYDKITYYPAISGSILPFGTLNAKMVRTYALLEIC